MTRLGLGGVLAVAALGGGAIAGCGGGDSTGESGAGSGGAAAGSGGGYAKDGSLEDAPAPDGASPPDGASGGATGSGGGSGGATAGPDGSAGESGGAPGDMDSALGGDVGLDVQGPPADAREAGADSGPSGAPPRVTKLDLLFMIDNSSSMADKQEVLAAAIPEFVNRLVDPICLEVDGSPGVPATNGVCPPNMHRDFQPLSDIHVGIISSSLGGHGASVCGASDPRPEAHNLDQAHLLDRAPGGGKIATFMNQGFLNWDGNGASRDGLVNDFKSLVRGVGQHGCGYEASLEAVYRFLVDPEPYASIVVNPDPAPLGQAVPTGVDADLLAQRRDFLRPDSLVVVVEITDENDCSIIDGQQNFYVISPPVTENGAKHSALAHGTSACLVNPNDRCCFNCNQAPPSGCPPTADDPECQKGYYTQQEDPENLRCFDQKRRYGIDFMYPVERYVEAFTHPTVAKRDGTIVQNPLFDDLQCGGTACKPARDPRLLFWAGIVGVPWQDIARDPRNLNKGYKTAAELAAANAWSVIIGDPAAHQPPLDPLMIESIDPRQGTNPALNAPLAPPGSAVDANPINGHEWNTSADTPQRRDLQYACVFALGTPKDCSATANLTDCDCTGNVAGMMNSLCQDGATYTTMQRRAKAYPGTRHLQVLQGLGNQGVVASICPAHLGDPNADDYGYRPAIAAVIDRMRLSLPTK